MPTLAEAVAQAPASSQPTTATAPLARAALESLARAVDGSERAEDNLAFVARMSEVADLVATSGRGAVLSLDLGDDVRAYAIIEQACVTIDVRNVRTGESPAPAVRFVTIAGRPCKVDHESEARFPLANLEFLEAETAAALSATRHQRILPEGVVSMAAWKLNR